MRKILILTANPKDMTRLRLGKEVREIDEGLKRAKHRDEFKILQQWATNPDDLQRAMLNTMPQIVHFSGHGAGEAGLYFEDESGNAQLVKGKALASLFKLISQKSPIDCVVLNGCYSEVQAKALKEHVSYVIGMNASMSDQAAIKFAVGFYDALGAGETVEFAFESGKVAMALNSTGDEDVPVLLKGPSVISSGSLPEAKTQPKEQAVVVGEEESLAPQIKRSFPIAVMLGTSFSSAVITAILRLLGIFSSLELATYDFFMRPAATDDRIVIVGIKDEDLDRWGETELSDWKLLKILEKINKANPSVIGLDIFRDEPQEDRGQVGKAQEHYDKLVDYLGNTSNKTVSTCLSNARSSDIGNNPPFEINEKNKSLVGFSNTVEDTFKRPVRIRRQLLRMDNNASACNVNRSLSYRIALTYLENEKNIVEEAIPELNYIKLGKTIFDPLFSPMGGYSDFDDGGYQILINYRVKEFTEVSAFETFNAAENSALLKKLQGKIVLVGYTSTEPNASNKDVHDTPIGTVSGVGLHAHMIRNIISPVYGEQPRIITLPGLDLVIIIFWAFLGGNLIWIFKAHKTHSIVTSVAVTTASITGVIIIIILVSYWLAFYLLGWWLPLIPSITGCLMGATITAVVNGISGRRRVKLL